MTFKAKSYQSDNNHLELFLSQFDFYLNGSSSLASIWSFRFSFKYIFGFSIFMYVILWSRDLQTKGCMWSNHVIFIIT